MRTRSHAFALASALLMAGSVPATADAGILSSLLRPKATATPKPTATPKATATPTPKPAATPTPTPKAAATPTPTPTPAAASVTAPAVGEMTSSCTETASFKAFAKFGDQADYAFAPGGSFENGAPGWSLSGASVVSGNETAGVYSGSKGLKIMDGGRVVSPWFCVTADHPNFRFVTYGGEVEMEIDYKVIGETDIDDDLVGETNGSGKWAPSASHELATEIPASKLEKGVLARIIFEAEDDIFVDNVLVDPYRRG